MLKLENINAYYGTVHALKDINFHIDEGEIVVLIGANGAGKTTTLKTISGILKPKAGRILFQGKDVNSYIAPDIVKLGISHVPEGRRIFPKMTVMENLEMGAYTRKDKSVLRSDYDNIFSRFPILHERRNQLSGTLSGGEQQMLAMGRALMSRPKLLLLDEPSMGLAPLIVKEIFEIIKDINKSGTTILLVEQNANMALKCASRAYVIRTGAIEIEGTAEELLNDERIKKAYLGG